jgi:hypothetical protein
MPQRREAPRPDVASDRSPTSLSTPPLSLKELKMTEQPGPAQVSRSLSRRGAVAGLVAAGGALFAMPNAASASPASASAADARHGAVDVKDYGAVGDGTHDDSRAIQAAVNAAQGGGGRTVFFPTGTYKVTSPIRTAPSRSSSVLSLAGAGMWQSVVVCPSPAGFFDAGSAVPRLLVEDLAFDGAGQQRAMFTIDGSSVHDFAFRRCRFTNLAGPIAAPAAVELVSLGTGLFADCMWHNPARYAGFGTAVRLQSQASGKRLEFRGDNRFLWLNNGIRTEAYTNYGTATTNTTVESLVVDGAYFDGFWWLLPASHSGEGTSVTYTATSLTDSQADFSDVPAKPRPNVINVRAMPVRHTGSVGAADSADLSEPGVDFVAAGVLRGEIVRAPGRWAAVARDPDRVNPSVLQVEEWLDDTTLLPTTPPSPGTQYTVFGVLIAAATASNGSSLTVENWRDRHGRDVLPDPGTRYEVLQVRPTYLFFVGPGGVLDLLLVNSTVRRGWADLAGIRPQASRVLGNHFADGQESGLVLSGGYQGHHVIGNTFTRIGNSAIYVEGSQSVITGNRITGGQTQRPLGATANDIQIRNGSGSVVAYNIAETGIESQTPHTMVLVQCTTGASTRNICAYNQKLGGLGEIEVMFLGSGNTDNEVVGSRLVGVGSGAPGQLIDMAGAGSPEGTIAAAQGSVYRRTDGDEDPVLYVKQSGDGASGWIPVGSGAAPSGGSGSPGSTLTARKTADTSITNSTALTADPDLAVPVAAGTTYILDACLIYQSDPAADLHLRWTGPQGAALSWTMDGISGGVTNPGSATINLLANTIATTPNLGGVGEDCIARPTGTLTIGDTAGTLVLQWAQAHAATSGTVMRAGSWIRLTMID